MYINRTITPYIKKIATQYPVITLTGPRQSGKTTLCRHLFDHYRYVSLEDLDTRLQANDDPRAFLQSMEGPTILDEIQRAPDLTSYIQTIVDQQQVPGQYILTGSQQFDVINSINQSLAGRTAVLTLLPLSYEEIPDKNNIPLNTLLFRGFYPRIIEKQLSPHEALSFYLSTYIERDIRRLINIKDLLPFERFLKLCAIQTGQLVNFSQFANAIGVDQKTIQSWLSILHASYIIYLLPPHFNNYKKRLVRASKLYFYDVGLACYLLGAQSPEQVALLPNRGFIFENFIISEIIKGSYHRGQKPNVYFYQEHSGHEVDLLIEIGTKIVTLEIKASKTFSQSFLKGLEHYYRINPEQNISRNIIYTGEKTILYKGTTVYPYVELEKILKSILLSTT